jgi:hypothetical protein
MSSNLKSKPQTPKPRPCSAYNRNTPLSNQKREKLKELLIAKFVKKFNTPYEILIRSEVSTFITQDKLTDKDLNNLELKLQKLINETNNKANLTNQLETKTINKILDDSKLEKAETVRETMYVPKTPHYTVEKASNLLNQFGLDYSEINDYKLRKLFNEKKPVNKITMNNDEWCEIAKYKNKVNEVFLKQQALEEKERKLKQRAVYLEQMEDKKNKKQLEKAREQIYHEATMDNVARLYQREIDEVRTLKDRKDDEKQIRDKQIQENIERKVNEFTNNRVHDKHLSKIMLINSQSNRK